MDPVFSPLVFFQGSQAISPSSTIFGLHESAKEKLPRAEKTSQVEKAILKLAFPFGNFKRSVLSLFHWFLIAFKLRKQEKIDHCLPSTFLSVWGSITVGFERGERKEDYLGSVHGKWIEQAYWWCSHGDEFPSSPPPSQGNILLRMAQQSK